MYRINNIGDSSAKPVICLLLISAIWAALYIPNLGIPAFSGMEGLRYSVAKEMLAHRDWLHLYFNGDPYYNKPPLAMWLIAPMIRDLDQIDEFSARLPFALSMLIMGTVTFLVGCRWLSPARAVIVALMPLTTVGALRFGRACEIDGLFAVLFLMAVVFWSDIWLSQRWRPTASVLLGVAIGLGGLCKGPLILGLFAAFCGLVALHARNWRRIPVVALGLGAAIPLLWVAAIYAGGLGHDALAAWTHEMAMRFDPHVVPVSEPPWIVQVLWAFSLTLPWSLLYPFLYLPGLLPRDPVVGALLRGGRDAGSLSFLAIMVWPGLQYQYFVPVGMLMALAVGIAVVAIPEVAGGSLPRGLRILTIAATSLLGVSSVAAALFLDTAGGIGAGLAGLLLCLTLARRPAIARTAVAEIRYTLAGLVGTAAIAVLVIIPPVSAVNQDRDIGVKLRAIVPPGERVFCPFSIDNMATYIQRPVLIYVPEAHRNYLYAILRDGEVASVRRSVTMKVQDMLPFRYLSGWRREPESLHLVLVTMKDSTQILSRDELIGLIQS